MSVPGRLPFDPVGPTAGLLVVEKATAAPCLLPLLGCHTHPSGAGSLSLHARILHQVQCPSLGPLKSMLRSSVLQGPQISGPRQQGFWQTFYSFLQLRSPALPVTPSLTTPAHAFHPLFVLPTQLWALPTTVRIFLFRQGNVFGPAHALAGCAFHHVMLCPPISLGGGAAGRVVCGCGMAFGCCNFGEGGRASQRNPRPPLAGHSNVGIKGLALLCIRLLLYWRDVPWHLPHCCLPCRGLCAAESADSPAVVSLGLWAGLFQDGLAVSKWRWVGDEQLLVQPNGS